MNSAKKCLSHEHLGSKISTKIIMYTFTRARFLCLVCYEIPCICSMTHLFPYLWFKCDSIKKFALPSRNRAFFQSIHNLRESRHWSVVLIAQSCLNLINLKNGHTCRAVFHFIIMSVMFLPLLPFTWNIPLK